MISKIKWRTRNIAVFGEGLNLIPNNKKIQTTYIFSFNDKQWYNVVPTTNISISNSEWCSRDLLNIKSFLLINRQHRYHNYIHLSLWGLQCLLPLPLHSFIYQELSCALSFSRRTKFYYVTFKIVPVQTLQTKKNW